MQTKALILAGGGGIRLWPLSRERKPKQFLPLFDNMSLVQQTFERLSLGYAAQDIFVATSENLIPLVREQLPNLPEENVIVEPFGRNTAAAIGLAMIHLQRRFAEEFVLAVFPSDHLIANRRDFLYSISLAAETAAITDGVIVLGVPPTRPETGLGYIQAFDETPRVVESFTSPLHAMRKILTFAEKPDIETAIRFLNSGDFLWNTGIFFARTSVLWKNYEEFLPDHLHILRLLQRHLDKDTYGDTLRRVYRQFRSTSIDYGIMEKSRNGYVFEGTFDWSDVSSWDSMHQLASKDADDNAIEGEVIAVNVSNSFVKAQKKLIALVDVDDLIVVDTDDALIICRSGHGQNVTEVVDFLRRKQMNDFL
jgi:mannose-1-phosphate guanylyltransferase